MVDSEHVTYVCLVLKSDEYRDMMETLASKPEEKENILNGLKSKLETIMFNIESVEFVHYNDSEWVNSGKPIDYYWFNFDKSKALDMFTKAGACEKYTPKMIKVKSINKPTLMLDNRVTIL